MTDQPYFFEAQLQLLRSGNPLVFPLQRRVSFVVDEPPTPFAAALRTSTRLTFRHCSTDGDPAAALEARLAPYLPVWLDEQPEPELHLIRYQLQASIVGDPSTCTAAHVLSPIQLAGARVEIVKYTAAMLLHEVARHLVERIVTGQHVAAGPPAR